MDVLRIARKGPGVNEVTFRELGGPMPVWNPLSRRAGLLPLLIVGDTIVPLFGSLDISIVSYEDALDEAENLEIDAWEFKEMVG